MKTIYFLTGILSNYRFLLEQAVVTGKKYGYRVRILDVIQLIPAWAPYPNPWKQLQLDSIVYAPGSIEELRKFAQENSQPGDMVIFLNLPDRNLRPIWRCLESAGYSMGVMSLNPVPIIRSIDPGKSSLSSDNNLLAGLSLTIQRSYLKFKSLFKPVPDIWIVSGAKTRECFVSHFRHTRGTRFIAAHSIDYEAVANADGQDNSGFDRNNQSSYFLFLDQGWYSKLQANFLPNGQYPPTEYSRYRQAVVAWLTTLQQESGTRVLISPHPKADPEKTRALYQGLDIGTKPTSQLIRNAKAVIGNCSTSIQVAVIRNKPIVLFSSDELDRSIMFPALCGYKEKLNAPVVNIDHPVSTEELLDSIKVDTNHYQQFSNDYIVQHDSGSGRLWDKVFAGLAVS